MKNFLFLITIAVLFVQCSPKLIPVHKEPRHHPVYISKNARVLDIRFPPGDTCLFHAHNNPYSYVMLTGGKLATQEPEKEFRSFTLPDAYIGGEFDFPLVPKIHRIANLDTDTLRFLAVENLQPKSHAIFKYHEHPFQELIENNSVFRIVKIEIPKNERHEMNFNTPTLLINREQRPFFINGKTIKKSWQWWENDKEVSIQNTQSIPLELYQISLK